MPYYKHIITTLLMTFTLTLTACGEGYQFPCDIWGGCPDEKSSSPPDTDGDGITDASDNCPSVANPDQQNLDRDQDGDACDSDTTIASVADLQQISVGSYRLIAQITVTGSWASISTFSGSLNGNDHEISGLNRPLFRTIASGASVTNLGINGNILADINLGAIAYSYATGSRDSDRNGGLVRYNSGTISNSYATGYSRGGGLVYENGPSGIISNSHATGYSDSRNSGGLVGINRGQITDSYATGHSGGYSIFQVNSITLRSGGLVGINRGEITNSYATGHSGGGRGGGGNSGYSGGLVGLNYGTIRFSYATGNSHTTRNVDGYSGGLVGRNAGGIITHSYATGNSSVGTRGYTGLILYYDLYSGGLVGYNSGTISNSYATGYSTLIPGSLGISSSSRRIHSGRLVGLNARGGTVTTSSATGYSGGLVDRNAGGIITHSYATGTGSSDCDRTDCVIPFGIAITLSNLRAVTAAQTGWSGSIWDFGDATQLPTITDLPDCPPGTSPDDACRW